MRVQTVIVLKYIGLVVAMLAMAALVGWFGRAG